MEKRPILLATIAYINGIIIGIYFLKSISLFIFILCIVITILLLATIGIIHKIKMDNKHTYKIKQNTIQLLIIYLIVICVSSIYTYNINEKYEEKYLKYNEQNIEIVGTVISDISIKQYISTFNIKVESINKKIKYKGDILIVNIKETKNIKLKNGDKIKFTAKYQEPSKARNYKGFDYKNYLKTKKTYGIVTIENKKYKLLKENNVNIIDSATNKIVQDIKWRCNQILPTESAGMAIGILTGYTNELNNDIKTAFKESNLSHLLAVSGSHITYIILTINLIFRKKLIGNKLQKIITILIMIAFTKITGNTPSVVRATLTCIILMLASLLHRKADTINSIAISTLATLIYNPFNLFNIGMQLSYAGTISIIMFYSLYNHNSNTKNKVKKYILDSVNLSISANIFIIPIIMYQFNTISTIFLFSNLLVSPLFGASIIIEIGLLILSIICMPIAKILGNFLNILIQMSIYISKFFAQIPISNIIVVTPNIPTMIIIYLIEILIYYYLTHKETMNYKFMIYIKRKYKTIIYVSIIAILLFNLLILVQDLEKRQKLMIHFIDVGQGDSCLIENESKKLLIDGGGNINSQNYDVGEKVLLPYLLDKGINKIDYIMISHFDADHYQGLEKVIDSIKVKNLIISRQKTITNQYINLIKKCKQKRIKIIYVKSGTKITISQNLYLEILHPSKNLLDDGKDGLNTNAIVTKIYYKSNKFTMLFTGDIDKKAENEIINKYENKLNADVLKVAHHGSKTSSSEEFIKRVSPKVSLIGVGKSNKFGHPNEETLKTLENVKSKIFRTDICGEINIEVNKTGKFKIYTQL